MKPGNHHLLLFLNQQSISRPAMSIAKFPFYLRHLLLLIVGIASLLSLNVQAAEKIIINRARLTDHQLTQLEQRLATKILPGRYWYDARSGLWGREGRPNAGQLQTNLPIYAPMPADISGGGTGVYVNGREIHPDEYRYLLRVYGRVTPGRYWLDASGKAGFEGGPAAFNIFADARKRKGVRWSSGHTERGGSVIGGDGVVGFIGTDGDSVICEGGSCTFN